MGLKGHNCSTTNVASKDPFFYSSATARQIIITDHFEIGLIYGHQLSRSVWWLKIYIAFHPNNDWMNGVNLPG